MPVTDENPEFYTLQRKMLRAGEWVTVDRFLNYEDAIQACRDKIAEKNADSLLPGIFRLVKATLMWDKEI